MELGPNIVLACAVLRVCPAVFYEELVERPEAVARRILSACGLPWEPGVLQFHDTKRSVQTASMEQVRFGYGNRTCQQYRPAWDQRAETTASWRLKDS